MNLNNAQVAFLTTSIVRAIVLGEDGAKSIKGLSADDHLQGYIDKLDEISPATKA